MTAPQLVWPTVREWALLVGVGAATQAAQVCMTYGMAREPAARAMAVGYLQVAFAVVWGVALFGETPALTTWLGAGLIGFGLLLHQWPLLARMAIRRGF